MFRVVLITALTATVLSKAVLADDESPSIISSVDGENPMGMSQVREVATAPPSPTNPDLFGIQRFMELLNNFARNIFSTLDPNNGGASPFNLRLPTLGQLLFPYQRSSPVRATPEARCVPKLDKELRSNDAYFGQVQKMVDEGNIDGAFDVLQKKATELCTPEQANRLKDLLTKYEKMRTNIRALVAEYPTEVRHKVLQWIRDTNVPALLQFLAKESLTPPFNSVKASKLMEISFQLTSMQIDLMISPI
ncbi:hypothetical protein Q1695_015044 [Nippostrongylus brasiliensis]|nr:hypothetical protein Q1695_015044 [Nippostrongylus brasiliensis]